MRTTNCEWIHCYGVEFPESHDIKGKWGNGSMCRMFYKIGFLEQLKSNFFCVRTLIEYCIFRTFSKILKRLRRGIGVYRRIRENSPDQARRTTMTMMTMTMKMTMMTMAMTTTTISRRRKPKPSKCQGRAGRGGGRSSGGGGGSTPPPPAAYKDGREGCATDEDNDEDGLGGGGGKDNS